MMDDLSDLIVQSLVEYSEELEQELEQEKEEIADEAVEELRSNSPHGRRGKYAKGWRKTKQGTGWIVHNKEARLTHLLEKGHAKRNGGRTKAQPHIQNVEERVIKRFENNVIKRAQG